MLYIYKGAFTLMVFGAQCVHGGCSALPLIVSIKGTGVCTALHTFSPLRARCPCMVLYGAYQSLLAMCLPLRNACPQCVRNSLSRASNLLGGDLDCEWKLATQCVLYTQPCQQVATQFEYAPRSTKHTSSKHRATPNTHRAFTIQHRTRSAQTPRSP